MRLAVSDAVGLHPRVKSPEEADAVFFVDLQQHPDDPFLRSLRGHPLVRAHRSKIFVFDSRDQSSFTFPGIYTSGTPGWARRHPIAGGPYPVLAPVRDTPGSPDLLLSFRGTRTHRVRDEVLRLRHPRAHVADTTGIDFVRSEDVDVATARERYSQHMTVSKFVLCPRGHGLSTFRLYETIRAGLVPVVISDGWLPPPRVAWSSCSIRVAESDVRRIPAILERREDDWSKLVATGHVELDQHLADDRLWHHYAGTLEALSARGRGRHVPFWAQPETLHIAGRWARAAARGRLSA